MEFVVSAPGKVILHGEHSVVYGKVVFILSKVYLFLIRKFRDVIQSWFIDLEHCSFLHINLSSAITMSPVLENEFISYLSVYICISLLNDFYFLESHRQQFKSSNNCQNQSTGRKHNFFRFFWPEHQRKHWFYWSNNIRKPSIRLICISVVIFDLENNQYRIIKQEGLIKFRI